MFGSSMWCSFIPPPLKGVCAFINLSSNLTVSLPMIHISLGPQSWMFILYCDQPSHLNSCLFFVLAQDYVMWCCPHPPQYHWRLQGAVTYLIWCYVTSTRSHDLVHFSIPKFIFRWKGGGRHDFFCHKCKFLSSWYYSSTRKHGIR